eukprot:SAG22_NODE_543_length_9289_cov_43.919151_4_plen_252_part_00
MKSFAQELTSLTGPDELPATMALSTGKAAGAVRAHPSLLGYAPLPSPAHLMRPRPAHGPGGTFGGQTLINIGCAPSTSPSQPPTARGPVCQARRAADDVGPRQLRADAEQPRRRPEECVARPPAHPPARPPARPARCPPAVGLPAGSQTAASRAIQPLLFVSPGRRLCLTGAPAAVAVPAGIPSKLKGTFEYFVSPYELDVTKVSANFVLTSLQKKVVENVGYLAPAAVLLFGTYGYATEYKRQEDMHHRF